MRRFYLLTQCIYVQTKYKSVRDVDLEHKMTHNRRVYVLFEGKHTTREGQLVWFLSKSRLPSSVLNATVK